MRSNKPKSKRSSNSRRKQVVSKKDDTELSELEQTFSARTATRIAEIQRFAPSRKFPAPRDVLKRGLEAIEVLERVGRPITLARLALSLGVSTSTYRSYESGENGEEYIEPMEILRTFVLADKNEKLLSEEYNTSGTIFDLKNNHGWNDGAQEINLNARMRVSAEPLTPDQWEQKHGPKQIEQG